ncbi:MAG TPA: M14 family metallopeptidase [Anaerolinea sp.]|nr:M14 family metallopeptidase [Anaerolinea sp.]
MDFNQYFTNDELLKVLQEWADTYPAIADLSVIGHSHEGNSIHLLTVTNFSKGADQVKPAVWVDGNLHATEIAGTTAVLYFLNSILTGYNKDEQITRLVDSCAFYAVPRINPDGAGLSMADSPQFIRSGTRRYPWEDMPEGLHTSDIDGNGRILQMRIPDPNGDWKVSAIDPRLMEKRTPAEHGGQYFRVLPEGMIEQYDGYLMNVGETPYRLDFNRNFPFDWHPESEQYGAGPYPASEPEIAAVVRFVSQHSNINAALTFHTFSRVLLRPYSTKPDDEFIEEDLIVYKQLGKLGTEITGYRNASTYHDFTYNKKSVTYGAFDDWMFDAFGAYAFTIELWDLPTEAGVENRSFTQWFVEHPQEDDRKIFDWLVKNGGEDAIHDWKPFEHPQLGRIELGGVNVHYTWRNPPAPFLEAEVSRHTPWILAIADMLPHLSLIVEEVKRLSETTWSINLVVENTGYFPTYTSQQARRRKIIRPVRASLKLPAGGRILTGKEHMEFGWLEGRSNKEITPVFAHSGTDNRGRVSWVVEAPAGSRIDIIVTSERAGSITRSYLLA